MGFRNATAEFHADFLYLWMAIPSPAPMLRLQRLRAGPVHDQPRAGHWPAQRAAQIGDRLNRHQEEIEQKSKTGVMLLEKQANSHGSQHGKRKNGPGRALDLPAQPIQLVL